MGQEIVYCHRCQTRLLGSDFERGKAFRINNQATCADCAKEILGTLPPVQRDSESTRRQSELKKGSTAKIPISRPQGDSSHNRISAITGRYHGAPSEKRSNTTTIVAVGGLLALAGLIVLIAAMSGGSRTPPRTTNPPVVGPPETPKSPDPKQPAPRPLQPRPTTPDKQLADAIRALAEARAFEKSNPDKLPEQFEKFRKAAFDADRTDIAREAADELERIRVRLKIYFRPELTELEKKVFAASSAGRFGEASRLVEDALKKHSMKEWTGEVRPLQDGILKAADASFRTKKQDALKRAREGDAAGADAILREVARWEIRSLYDELDRALKDLAKGTPKTPAAPAFTADFVIYDDALGAGWREYSFDVTADLANEKPALSGSRSISIAAKRPWGGFRLIAQSPFSTIQYTALTFAARRTDASVGFLIHLYDENQTPIAKATPFEKIGGLPPTDDWKTYTVSMAQLGAPARRIGAIIIQPSRDTSKPSLFIDNIGLLKRIPGGPSAAPVDPKLPAAIVAYRAEWKKAAKLASLRKYEQAVAALEKTLSGLKDEAAKKEAEADLADLKGAAALLARSRKAFSAWPRGRNLDVFYADPSGLETRINEPVRRSDPFRAGLRGKIVIPFGEILAGSLARLALGAVDKPADEDLRAAAILSLYGGDLAGASDFMKNPPAKIREHGEAVIRKRVSDEAELKARKLLYEAELEYDSYVTRLGAIARYRTLLKSHGKTDIVTRNREALEARAEGGTEYFFSSADLRGSGLFHLQDHPKGGIAWTSGRDVKTEALRLENYVELEFSVLPDTEYRGWAFVGGCCAETFRFHQQGTDLEGPDPNQPQVIAKAGPGSAVFIEAEHGIRMLKKYHVEHSEDPKAPERWVWAKLRMPAYATGGKKTLRILSAQKGFSVVHVLISSTRKTFPTTAETRALAAERPTVSPEALAAGVATGSILREVWEGIDGDTVANLTNHSKFKGPPSITSHVTSFEGPTNWANRYGTRMRGYVHPPATGDYVFWIATDDHSELWLSSGTDPKAKVRIAHQVGSVGKRAWTSKPTQKSKPIRLIRGQRYYIEALQKEGGGDDHLAVGWTLPNGKHERPIPGYRLSPFTERASSFSVSLTSPEPDAELEVGKSVPITATVHGEAKSLRVDAYQGGIRIGSMRGDPLKTTWRIKSEGTYSLTVVASARGKQTAVSPPSLFQVGEETYPYRAINFNGPGVVVDSVPWEGRTAKSHEAAGEGLELQDLELSPPTDPGRARMIRSSIASRDGTRVTLTTVPPGEYRVYLYVWEPERANSYDVELNGETVETGHKTSRAGSWARLGPWPVKVDKGIIELAAKRGVAHFSGIEIRKIGSPPPAPKVPVDTEIIGGRGGRPFREAPPERPFLLGFRVSRGTFEGKPHAKTLQPIYLKDGVRTEGDIRGDATGNITEIVAKPGYAVGALVGKGDQRVNGFKAIFMRISGNVLNPADSYESEWVGGDWGPEKRIDGNGAPVVGVHGREGGDTDCIGLIYLK